jgi:hypothetical protein
MPFGTPIGVQDVNATFALFQVLMISLIIDNTHGVTFLHHLNTSPFN